MGNKKLKPCPFCGGRASIFQYIPDKTVAIRCDQCGAALYRSAALNSEEILVAKWNHRQDTLAILHACNEFNEATARLSLFENNNLVKAIVMQNNTLEKIENIARKDNEYKG